MQGNYQPQFSDIIFYSSPEGNVKVEVIFNDETFWLSQKRMAELFGVESHTITYHLKEIFKTGELEEDSTARKIRVVEQEKMREVECYSLDALIAVGFRMNSESARQFRIWAIKRISEFSVKGFLLDDERLKHHVMMSR